MKTKGVVARTVEAVVRTEEVLAKTDEVVAKADAVVAEADEVVTEADAVVTELCHWPTCRLVAKLRHVGAVRKNGFLSGLAWADFGVECPPWKMTTQHSSGNSSFSNKPEIPLKCWKWRRTA